MKISNIFFYKSILIVSITLSAATIVAAQDEVRNFGNCYVLSGAVVNIAGNYNNTNTGYYKNNGTMIFGADITNNQTGYLSGTGTTIWTSTSGTKNSLYGNQIFNTYNITFDNPNGFVLNNNLGVSNTATFSNGIITTSATPNYIIFSTPAASYTGVSDASHVNGWVRKIGNTAFTFPVGDATKYRPAGISVPSVDTDEFDCKYYHATAPNPGSVLSPVESISSSEYWQINRHSGTSNVALTLTWDQAHGSLPATTADKLGLTRYDGANWVNISGAPYDGTTNPVPAIGSLTSMNVDGSSLFTFTKRVSVVLPIDDINLSAVLVNGDNNNVVNLSWSYRSSTDISKFEVEKSITNATQFNKIADINLPAQEIQSYKDQISGQDKIFFYRIKGVDVSGSIKYSNIVSVRIDTKGKLMFWPNPVQKVLNVAIVARRTEKAIFRLIATGGKLVAMKQMELVQGQNFIQFNDFSNLASGNYWLHVQYTNGERAVIHIVKE